MLKMESKILVSVLLSMLLFSVSVFALEEGVSKCNLEDLKNSEKFDGMVLMQAMQKNLTDEMKLFLYFDHEISNNETQEIEQLGVTIYNDSWIPPVGNHPLGFYSAKSKVENICKLVNLDSVKRISSGERLLEPQAIEELPSLGISGATGGKETLYLLGGIGILVILFLIYYFWKRKIK